VMRCTNSWGILVMKLRKEVLTATKKDGKTVYLQGLVA